MLIDPVLTAEKVRVLIALVARSAIDPPFRSRVVLTAMPSLSNSVFGFALSLATV